MKIEIVRVDGTREQREINRRNPFKDIDRIIDCNVCDTVNMRDGRVMIVDDLGLQKNRPVNPAATEIYQSIYPRAKQSGAVIVGDVVIANDEDFA